jgi:hypothetical protein
VTRVTAKWSTLSDGNGRCPRGRTRVLSTRPSGVFMRARALTVLTVLTALAATLLATGPAVAAPGAVSVGNADIGAPCATATTPPVPIPNALCRFDLAGTPGVEVVDSPAAKYGTGYLRLSTPTADDRASVAKLGDGVLTVGDLARNPLAYETYVEVPSGVAAPSFNIGVLSTKVPNANGTPQFTTLVWEPTYTGATIATGQWQAWSPSSAAGGWWATRTLDDPTATNPANRYRFVNYQATFAQAVAGVGPDAIVTNIGVNQGRGPAGLVAGVDLLTFDGTTYDFENPTTASAIAPSAGNNQSAAAGKPFATPLAATVTGGTRPVTGTPVVFRVTSGSASFPGNAASASATTGATGVATAPVLTAGTTPGPVTITATAGSGAATEAVVSTTFSATVTAPPPAAVTDLAVAVSAPATGRPGNSFVATVTVTNKGTAPVARATTVVTLQGGLLVLSAPDAVKPAVGKSLTILDGPLAPGASVTHRVTVIGSKAGNTAVQAVTASAGTDATPADNTATAAVRLG